MIKKLLDKFKKKPELIIEEKPRNSIFSTHADEAIGFSTLSKEQIIEWVEQRTFQQPPPRPVLPNGATMDGIGGSTQFQIGANYISPLLLQWYGAQGFIGFQLCGILSQHWLIDKACTMPARDAIRKGYDITINDGTKIKPEIQREIRNLDKRYRLAARMVEYIRKGRIFGIRVAIFQVENSDPTYYEKPFNIDGVKPGSYRGITMIDPYWITPELDFEATTDPFNQDFYEPTWWRVNGKRYHKSHCMVFRTGDLPDALKPTYFYGSVSIPQRIYERVYGAERTANEAPMLALTKRLYAMKIDVSQALMKPAEFNARMELAREYRDNYGFRMMGLEDEIMQFDTSLNDLDAVIMSQYTIAAAIAAVPVVKLMGTSPKGFNATGEFEEASYHEELESLQTHDLSPFLEKHYQLVIKSDIAPKFNLTPFEIDVTWNSLDSMTAKELVELNKLKVEAGKALIDGGVLRGQDERDRLIADPQSGYSGIDADAPEEELDLEDNDEEEYREEENF